MVGSRRAISAAFDDDGYVHIVGRAKDLVISGGYNVYPKEVETELDALPGVLESAVFGVPHPDFGEGVTAVVVPEARRGGVGSRHDPVHSVASGAIQNSQANTAHRRIAAKCHGQGAEKRAARGLRFAVRRGRRASDRPAPG
jgi:acyl-CoA synthetase (AMP-forming)/AMP-acid ligase II